MKRRNAFRGTGILMKASFCLETKTNIHDILVD